MNISSQGKKIVIKLRYQIQYTNQISENEHFQSTAAPQVLFLKLQRYPYGWKTPQKMQSKPQRAQIYHNTLSKVSPIIHVHNPHTHRNYVAKKQQQKVGKNEYIQGKEDIKMNDENSTAKKSKQMNNSTMMTATPNDIKRLVQDQKRTKNLRKGLAWISQHILYLLEGEYGQQKKFTCSEISQKVLTDFYSKAKQHLNDNIEQKEKKTIRRRVYDSINVLIALGKIKKDHKFLYAESIDRRMGEEIIALKKEKLAQVKRQMSKREQLVSKVRREYAKLVELKQRNEELCQSRQQGYSGTFSTFFPSQANIYKFPLLLVYGQQGSKMTVECGQVQQRKNRQQIIVCVQPLYLLSDLSSLQYVNLSSSRTHRKNSLKSGTK